MTRKKKLRFRGAYRTRILNKFGVSQILCYRCGQPIREGSWIHTNQTFKKFYHDECWKGMLL